MIAFTSARWAEKNARDLETVKLERQEKLRIYERIEAQLGSAAPHSLLIAAAYTRLIQEAETRQELCELINLVAISRIQQAETMPPGSTDANLASLRDVARQSRDCAEQMQRLAQYETKAAHTEAEKTSASEIQQAAQNEAPPGEVLTSRPNPRGWDIDVFSCVGQGEPSRLLARKIAQRFVDIAERTGQLGTTSLGRIRLRTASGDAQRQTIGGEIGHSVIASSDEIEFANAIIADLRGTDAPVFRLLPTSFASPWYVSIWACGFPQS